MGLYSGLAAHYRSGALRTDEVTVFQLDEYLRLAAGDRRSLLRWTRRNFLEPFGIRDEQVVPLPLPLDGDVEESCAAFDRAAEAWSPRHRDPGSRAQRASRLQRAAFRFLVADACGRADGRHPSGQRPILGQCGGRARQGRYDGPAPAARGRRIVMVVSGAIKRAIVHRALEGPVGPEVPASFLQTAEAEVTVIVDRAAWGDG
jgi:glucosamine-6-phosphate deaminase